MEFDEDPFWAETQTRIQKQQSKTSNATIAGVLVGLVVAMFAARYYFPDSSAGGTTPLVAAAPKTTPSAGSGTPSASRAAEPGWAKWLQEFLPGDKPLRVRSNFDGTLKDWVGAGNGWTVAKGTVHPGRLRIWKPTVKATNYDVDFQAAVQKKGVSWAYRAKDTRNYYATRILITRSGEPSGASIVRYGVEEAVQFAKAELPLPIALFKDRPYRVTVSVRGSRFATMIDGQVVDEWQDTRHRAGGVGFFAEEGEASAIDWVDFRERKGWIANLLSATLFLPPGTTF